MSDLDRMRQELRQVMSKIEGNGNKWLATDYSNQRIYGVIIRGGGVRLTITIEDLVHLALQEQEPENKELMDLVREFFVEYLQLMDAPFNDRTIGGLIPHGSEMDIMAHKIIELISPPPPKTLEQKTIEILNWLLEPGSPVLEDDKHIIGALVGEWEARHADTTDAG